MTSTPNTTSQQIRLPDGRHLGYAEHGAPDGHPVFFFHGIPGSRLLRHPNPMIAVELGVRLIAPDRPGMGLSDFRPGHRLLDWPANVIALADALGIERFAVAVFSGGGPFAVVCGYAMPERVTSVGLVSGVGPVEAPGALEHMLPSNRMGYAVGRWMPWPLWRLIFNLFYGGVRRHPGKLAQMSEEEPVADHIIFEQNGMQQILVETFAEAFRQGTMGAAWEGWLLAHPWGFDLAEVRPHTFLWQGEDDVVVTPAMGRHMAAAIPDCSAAFLRGEGHLLFVPHWREILVALTT